MKLQEPSNKQLRCIVFVQQRVAAHVLEYFVIRDPDLSPLGATCIYSSSSPATASLRLSPTELRNRLDLFKRGTASILVATNVAEEGMDIPAANAVVHFDPVQTPVSLVQSRGRARQQDSSFVVMQVSTINFKTRMSAELAYLGPGLCCTNCWITVQLAL